MTSKDVQLARTLHADVFLGSHGQHYGLVEKLPNEVQASIRLSMRRRFRITSMTYEKQFQDELAKQSLKTQQR